MYSLFNNKFNTRILYTNSYNQYFRWGRNRCALKLRRTFRCNKIVFPILSLAAVRLGMYKFMYRVYDTNRYGIKILRKIITIIVVWTMKSFCVWTNRVFCLFRIYWRSSTRVPDKWLMRVKRTWKLFTVSDVLVF